MRAARCWTTRAREAYRRWLTEIEEDIEEAHRFNDPGRVELAEWDRGFLVAELSRAVSLGRRGVRPAPPGHCRVPRRDAPGRGSPGHEDRPVVHWRRPPAGVDRPEEDRVTGPSSEQDPPPPPPLGQDPGTDRPPPATEDQPAPAARDRTPPGPGPGPPPTRGLGPRRHVGAVVLGLVLTPIALVLLDHGLGRRAEQVNDLDLVPVDTRALVVVVVGAVLLLAVAALGRVSPLGPLLAGLVWGWLPWAALTFWPTEYQSVLEYLPVIDQPEWILIRAGFVLYAAVGALLVGTGIAAAWRRPRRP